MASRVLQGVLGRADSATIEQAVSAVAAIDQAVSAVAAIKQHASAVAAIEQAVSAVEFLARNPVALDQVMRAAETQRAAALAIASLASDIAETQRALDASGVIDAYAPAVPLPRCAVRTDRPTRRVRSESLTIRASLRYRRRFACRTPAPRSGGRCRANGRGARMEPLQPGGQIEYDAPHARRRMERRGITEDHVRATLEHPDQIRPAFDRPPTGPCNIYLRWIGGRRCKVYVRIASDPMLVATAAWHGE